MIKFDSWLKKTFFQSSFLKCKCFLLNVVLFRQNQTTKKNFFFYNVRKTVIVKIFNDFIKIHIDFLFLDVRENKNMHCVV